jgi:hypothetical protein
VSAQDTSVWTHRFPFGSRLYLTELTGELTDRSQKRNMDSPVPLLFMSYRRTDKLIGIGVTHSNALLNGTWFPPNRTFYVHFRAKDGMLS